MVLSLSPATLQTAGVSARKAVYLHSLAAAFTSSAITPQFLSSATDEEIVAELTKIHGIGQWSAEMFLMFGLKRMDVFSVGDLGIQRGMAAWQGRNVKALKKGGGGRGKKWKYMGEKEMMDLAAPFGPYRSTYTRVEMVDGADGRESPVLLVHVALRGHRYRRDGGRRENRITTLVPSNGIHCHGRARPNTE